MFFTRHRVASAAVFAVLAAGLPGALAVGPPGPAVTGRTASVTPPALSPPGCPDPNPAWGCGAIGAGQGPLLRQTARMLHLDARHAAHHR